VPEEMLKDGGVRSYFSLWAVGPVLFAGVPGELSAELGLFLKWFSPFPKTYVMYLATDRLGYISHPNAYVWGGYEARNSLCGPTGGMELCRRILTAAGDLKLRMEADGRQVALPGSIFGE
jgi:hypothetical protein